MNTLSAAVAAAALSVTALAIPTGASAFSLPAASNPVASVAAPAAELVRLYFPRRGGHFGHFGHRGGFGGGVGIGAAILGGAILGSALDNSYYGYDGYDSGPSYYYGGGYGGGSSYCASRFRTYDPASGTYVGYDGRRHPCP